MAIALKIESYGQAGHLNLLHTNLLWYETMNSLHSLTRRLRMALRWQGPRHAELAALAQEITNRMERLSECDSLASATFRKQIGLRLRDFAERLGQFCEGRLTFESTETWRTVYEDVLKACQPRRYLSVALIRTDEYWRDAPGENSLQFNYQLIDDGYHVHRVFIIDDFFWPKAARTPSTDLFRWIQNQRQRGVEVSLARLAELDNEPTLVSDMGIYGSDAVGWQQTDLEGRTVRYEVTFDRTAVTEAEQRWHQLLLFAKPFDAIVEVN